jgi:hypothetical protein
MVAGVSRQSTGPMFKVREIQDETDMMPETWLRNYHYTLCNHPEDADLIYFEVEARNHAI